MHTPIDLFPQTWHPVHRWRDAAFTHNLQRRVCVAHSNHSGQAHCASKGMCFWKQKGDDGGPGAGAPKANEWNGCQSQLRGAHRARRACAGGVNERGRHGSGLVFHRAARRMVVGGRRTGLLAAHKGGFHGRWGGSRWWRRRKGLDVRRAVLQREGMVGGVLLPGVQQQRQVLIAAHTNRVGSLASMDRRFKRPARRPSC